MTLKSYYTQTGFEIRYKGPDLGQGEKPAVFYFALSAKDSLCLDPFNQYPLDLMEQDVRIFSMTLPGHENDLPKEKAIEFWAKQIAKGRCPLTHFFDEAKTAYTELKKFIPEGQCAFAGLSRGGFVALHLAAMIPEVKVITAFAPLIDLSCAQEFDTMNSPLIDTLNLDQKLDKLVDKTIKIFIGNRDVRVGTEKSFQLITALANLAYEKRLRTSSFQMNLCDSIGQHGHGTSPETFHEGAMWTLEQIQTK